MAEQLLVLFGVFFLFLLLRFPVFFALLASMVAHYIFFDEMSSVVLAFAVSRGLENTTLTAIPYFFVVGAIMNAGGITARLLRLATALLGWCRGGLAQVNIGASILFGGISGSAAADVSAIGSVMIPAMKQDGYSGSYAAAVTATSSTIGLLIPPSIPMVMFGLFNNVAVDRLFFAGLLPGVLMGVYLMITCAIIAKRRAHPAAEWAGLSEVVSAFKGCFLALLLPVLIIICLLSGIATVSEVGAVAVVYAMIISRFVYKDATLQEQWAALKSCAVDCARILSLIAVGGGMLWIVSNAGGGRAMVGFIVSLELSPLMFLLLVAALLVALGTVVGPGLQMILIIPTLTPVAMELGIDVLHFAVTAVLASAMGLVTPPIGFLIFLTAAQAEVDVKSVMIESVPFLVAQLVLLSSVVFFPQLSTALPSVL